MWSTAHTGVPKFQLDPHDSPQRRALRIVGDPNHLDRFESLEWRRDFVSLCVTVCHFVSLCVFYGYGRYTHR